MSTELLLEAFLSLLLMIACGYGVVLNSKLKKIHREQADLMGMIEKFDDAALRVSDNISTMHSQRNNVEHDLKRVVERANFLMDELSVMVNAGDNIAGRLEGAVEQVRNIGLRQGGASNKVSKVEKSSDRLNLNSDGLAAKTAALVKNIQEARQS